MTLGHLFKILKLNPDLVISEQLSSFLVKRNLLVHDFFEEYLYAVNIKQQEKVILFCDNFLNESQTIEKFFRGFLSFLDNHEFYEKDGEIFKRVLLKSEDEDLMYFFENFSTHNEIIKITPNEDED